MKYCKLLAISFMMGFTLFSNIANAATPSAEQTLKCTLGSFVNITPNPDSTLTATIDADTGALSNDLISKFNVELNEAKTLYLTASAESSTGKENAFFQNGGDVYVVLSHTTNKATQASIEDIKKSAPTPANNANALAYKITSVVLTGASSASTVDYKATENRYEISALAGKTEATTTIGTSVLNNTYSFADTAGDYVAVVTLTSTST